MAKEIRAVVFILFLGNL